MQTTLHQDGAVHIGLYSVSEAARLLHLSQSVVSSWAVGRPSRASQFTDAFTDQALHSVPTRTQTVFVKPPERVGGQTLLTFAHLIELRMVQLFRSYGVSMPVIKAAARNAARLLNSEHPFSSLKLHTNGQRIFADMKPAEVVRDGEKVDDARVVQDLKEMQIVMGDIARLYFKDTDYNEDLAVRWWLLGREHRAVLDPQRGFGQPLDSNTGVPLEVLYKLVKAGETVQAAANWYEVPVAAVEEAVNFYNALKMK